MMRKILFRGKCYDDGEWIFGSLLDDDIIVTKGAVEVDEDYINVVDEWSSVLPETVGQFTGLKDKNGKRIFEGDIVCYSNAIFRVEWSLKYCAYLVVSKFSGGEDLLINYDNCEVIGNIHDSPELLEVQG